MEVERNLQLFDQYLRKFWIDAWRGFGTRLGIRGAVRHLLPHLNLTPTIVRRLTMLHAIKFHPASFHIQFPMFESHPDCAADELQ